MPLIAPPSPPVAASQPAAYTQGEQVGSLLSQWTRRLQSGGPSLPSGVVPGVAPSQQELESAAASIPNLRLALRTTIDGQPVVPPGMTIKQASMYVSHDWMGQHINQARTLVFISMSMPKSVIRNILDDIWSHQALRDEAVVVVRGWQPEPLGLPQLVQQIGDLQPSLQHQVNVAVDPILFESYDVHQVPAVARRSAAGAWHILYGDRDLPSNAVRILDRGRDFGATRGQTWPIAEPDLINVMQQRMRAYAWERQAKEATNHYFATLPGTAPSLPESRKPLTFFHDPAVVVQHDIKLPDGRVLAHAGQVINPLLNTSMPWATWRAVVFNAQSPWEVQQAKDWAAKYPGARLMMTSPPDTQSGYVALEKSFGRPVYIASPLVIQKLGVRFSPSLVWPDGPQLQIFVPPIPADPGLVPVRGSTQGGH